MRGTIILISILLCLVPGLALADTGVPQTPETQGIVSATTISALGTVTETDTLAWQNFNCGLCGLEDITPLYEIAHAVYSTSYSENTVADQGLVSYTKQTSLDTQGKVVGQYNLETAKVVEFVGLDTGRMVSDETTVMDGAGTFFPTEVVMICPFAEEQSLTIPAFCNIVEEGSSLDLTLGSVTTSTEERHTLPFAGYFDEEPGWDLPVSDAGTEMNYNVKVTGFGDVPAMGSTEAFITAHIQESRYTNTKAEDLTYSEVSTAAGDITLFQKSMNYNSKLTGGGGAPVDL